LLPYLSYGNSQSIASKGTNGEAEVKEEEEEGGTDPNYFFVMID
jgi:hypothetical protein